MTPNDGPRYSSHPRYSLRRFIILIDILGLFLCIYILSSYPLDEVIVTSFTIYFVFWLLVSIALSAWDLVSWKVNHLVWSTDIDPGAAAESQPLLRPIYPNNTSNRTTNRIERGDGGDNNDETPDKPPTLLFFVDFILAIILFVVWTCVLEIMNRIFSYCWSRYDCTTVTIISSYASISLILSSICHFVCSWKELMASKKNGWQQTIGSRRQHFEDHLNRVLAASRNLSSRPTTTTATQEDLEPGRETEQQQPQPQARSYQSLSRSRGRESHSCCDHTRQIEELMEWRRQENTLVERLVRVLGKTTAQQQQPINIPSLRDSTMEENASAMSRTSASAAAKTQTNPNPNSQPNINFLNNHTIPHQQHNDGNNNSEIDPGPSTHRHITTTSNNQHYPHHHNHNNQVPPNHLTPNTTHLNSTPSSSSSPFSRPSSFSSPSPPHQQTTLKSPNPPDLFQPQQPSRTPTRLNNTTTTTITPSSSSPSVISRANGESVSIPNKSNFEPKPEPQAEPVLVTKKKNKKDKGKSKAETNGIDVLS